MQWHANMECVTLQIHAENVEHTAQHKPKSNCFPLSSPWNNIQNIALPPVVPKLLTKTHTLQTFVKTYTHILNMLPCKMGHFTSQNQVPEKTHKRASSFPHAQDPKLTIFSNCVYNSDRGAGGFEWQRRQRPILTTYTIHYIRAALSRLAATEHSLIYMIIGGRRAQRDNKGETQHNAELRLQTEWSEM